MKKEVEHEKDALNPAIMAASGLAMFVVLVIIQILLMNP